MVSSLIKWILLFKFYSIVSICLAQQKSFEEDVYGVKYADNCEGFQTFSFIFIHLLFLNSILLSINSLQIFGHRIGGKTKRDGKDSRRHRNRIFV